MTQLRLTAIVLGSALVGGVGCQRTYQDFTSPPDATPPSYPSAVAARLPTGVARGRVVWAGERPTVPPIRGLISTPKGPVWGEVPNPHAPAVGHDRGIDQVVVWLNGVDRTRLKPWPYPQVALVQNDVRLDVLTNGPRRVGFVKLGDQIEMVARGERYHSLRARGAAFFTLPFPTPDRPLKRTLDRTGHVEFTSAAGYYWSADVFVCDHPYHTTTDANGRFELSHVAPGEYELVAWLRNWTVTGRDRDPETGKLVRLHYAEPFVVKRRVVVTENRPTEVELSIGP